LKYEYSIIGKRLELVVPGEVNIGTESKEFLFPKSAGDIPPADFVAHFKVCNTIPEPGPDARVIEDVLYERTAAGYRMFSSVLGKRLSSCTEWDFSTGRAEITVLPDKAAVLGRSTGLSMYIGFETVFMLANALMLHSSFVKFNECGILFSAPSGTGKSTQAELWKEHMGADIINGDRAGVINENGSWVAYGLNYAGSSNIFRNEKAPVKAVVMLKQGPENTIRRLGAREALTLLYPQLSIHVWDDRFVTRALNILQELITTVPVYELSCLPDKGAVELLHNTLF